MQLIPSFRRGRRAAAARRRAPRARAGFTFVEIMVSMTLLSMVVIGIAGLSAVAAHRARETQSRAATNAALLHRANMLAARPYANLTVAASPCTQDQSQSIRVMRCDTVRAVTGGIEVKVVNITSLGRGRADTTVLTIFRQTPPPATNPFNTAS